MVNQLLRKLKKVVSRFQHHGNNDISITIERSWSTDTAIGIKGFIQGLEGKIDHMKIHVDDVTAPVTNWQNLESNENIDKNLKSGEKKGFWIQIPRKAHHRAKFEVSQSDKIWRKSIAFEGSSPETPHGYPSGEDIFKKFVQKVNDEHLHVLEIGSRIIPPKTEGLRKMFSKAASYTGFDYYPDSNTDVVGDAHRLSSYFDGKKFDAVFTIAVFEHLAMPWVVAMEINKILKIGGISCHQIPFAWPAHELPWDFWRCSDEGLKILFSPSIGFATIDSGMYAPLRMYFDTPIEGQEGFPEGVCFGCSVIFSSKTSELDPEKFRWDVNRVDVLGEGSHYPPLKK